jgi:hypothetical protein
VRHCDRDRDALCKEQHFWKGALPDSKAVKERIEELIAQAPGLLPGYDDYHRQLAWLTSAQYAVQLVCSSSTNPYFKAAQDHVTRGISNDREEVPGMAALMTRLLEEIDRGLLTTIENHAIAATFDDFLDHGAEYLKHGRKNEAAVIAGIVFEDTIRPICRVLRVTENADALDALISELAKQHPPVLTTLKAKRARAAAGYCGPPRLMPGGTRSTSATWPR